MTMAVQHDRVFNFSRIFLPTGKGCFHCNSTYHYNADCPLRLRKLLNGRNRFAKQNQARSHPPSNLESNAKPNKIGAKEISKSYPDSKSNVKEEELSNKNKSKSTNKKYLSEKKTHSDKETTSDDESNVEDDDSSDESSEGTNDEDEEDESEDDSQDKKVGNSGDIGAKNRAPICYNCQRVGHISRECHYPHLFTGQSGGVRCYNCGRNGHFARNCTSLSPDSQTRESREMVHSRLNTFKCYNCGAQGHSSRNCTKPKAQICYKCQQEGHIRTDCPN